MASILQLLVDSKNLNPQLISPFQPSLGIQNQFPSTSGIHALVGGILSTAEWSKLYDLHTRTPVNDGSGAPILINHLYLALLLKLRGPAANYATSRRDLHGDGIALIHALHSTYRNVFCPSELVAIEHRYNNMLRPPDQPIETFVNGLKTLHNDIIDNGGISNSLILHRNFILNIGPDFSQIRHLYETNALP